MSFLEEDTPEQATTSAPKKKENSLWCERYRPTTLETYVGNDLLKAKIKQYISENDIPHLLLYGGAGGGKTSAAKLITSSIKCDVLYINASDENGIDTIRNKVCGFASNIGFNPLKVIILDEADALTPDGQRALRNTMETFSLHSRFILTCNYHERIIEPIVSRCQTFEVVPPSKANVAKRLFDILAAEKITFDKEAIVSLVNACYPDIRAVINTAQRNVKDGKLEAISDGIIGGDIKKSIIELLTAKNRDTFKQIRQIVADAGLRRFEGLYTSLYENSDKFALGKEPMVIIAIADAQCQDSFVPDKEICFMSCIAKILETIT